MFNIFKRYQTYEQIVPDYLSERKLFLKRKTFANEKGKVERFGEWLIKQNLENKALKNISARDIGYFSKELAIDLDKPTCQNYIKTLQGIWKYAQKIGEYPKRELPFYLVVIPHKKGDFSPDVIPLEIFDDLCESMKKKDPSLYVAAMVMYYAMLRPGNELIRTTTGSYDFDKRGIHVTQELAKTGVARTPTMVDGLYEILLWYELDKAPLGKFLFARRRKYSDYPVHENNLPHRFMPFRKEFHLAGRNVWYCFKHTGITDMLNAGIAIPFVMQQAGHTKLSSTQHYAKKYAGNVNQLLLNYRRTA